MHFKPKVHCGARNQRRPRNAAISPVGPLALLSCGFPDCDCFALLNLRSGPVWPLALPPRAGEVRVEPRACACACACACAGVQRQHPTERPGPRRALLRVAQAEAATADHALARSLKRRRNHLAVCCGTTKWSLQMAQRAQMTSVAMHARFKRANRGTNSGTKTRSICTHWLSPKSPRPQEDYNRDRDRVATCADR